MREQDASNSPGSGEPRAQDGKGAPRGYTHRSARPTGDQREYLIRAAVRLLPRMDPYKASSSIRDLAGSTYKLFITRQCAQNILNQARARMRAALHEAVPDLEAHIYQEILDAQNEAKNQKNMKATVELIKVKMQFAKDRAVGGSEKSEFNGIEFRIRDPERPAADQAGGELEPPAEQ